MPKPAHILFLIDQLTQLGGAERVLFRMVSGLQQKNFRCSLATFRDSLHPEVRQQLTCPLHIFPLKRTYDWNAVRQMRALGRLLREDKVDIVHTFFETSDLWGGMVAKLSGDKRLISTRRDMGILRTGKHRWAYRMMAPMFDRVITVSDAVRTVCIEQDGLPEQKVLTVYNGIELAKVDQDPPDANLLPSLPSGEPLITMVGNVRRVKGVDVFLRAAAQVRRECPAAHFLVLGEISEPDFFSELQKQAAALDLKEHFTFYGGVKDVVPFLRRSNMFCMLSRSEGFSNAVLEAMACSLPCVVTHVGGNAEAVAEGESGYLVASGNAEAAADRILRLLCCPERARQMGAAGRQRVEQHFTTEHMIDQLSHIYEGLAGPKPAVQ